MSILDYFRTKQKSSASIAKERLQIIVSHQRVERNSPDYLPMLQKELIEVISKYVPIDPDQVKVDISQDNTHSVLELNIALPDPVDGKQTAVTQVKVQTSAVPSGSKSKSSSSNTTKKAKQKQTEVVVD